MLGVRRHEQRPAFGHLERLALHFERPAPLEHDVHLVVLVRLLAVGLRRDEDVDADLEPRRAVDDLVAAVRGDEPPLDVADFVTGTGLRMCRRGQASDSRVSARETVEESRAIVPLSMSACTF